MTKPTILTEKKNLWPDLDCWENEDGALLAAEGARHKRQASTGKSGIKSTRICAAVRQLAIRLAGPRQKPAPSILTENKWVANTPHALASCV